MGLGQPEDKLTVIVRYPNGYMRVHLHEVLARTNKRYSYNKVQPDGTTVHGYVIDYPLSYCRKLFKFMTQWLTEEDLERVDQFIKESGKEKLYEEWAKQRELGGR